MNYDYVGGTLRCKICAKEFFTKNEADEHYKTMHAGEVTTAGE